MKTKTIGHYEERYFQPKNKEYDYIGRRIEYKGTYQLNTYGYKKGQTRQLVGSKMYATSSQSIRALKEIEKSEKKFHLGLAVKK